MNNTTICPQVAMTQGECQAITNYLERTKTSYLLDSSSLLFDPINNTDFTTYFTYLPRAIRVLMAQAGGDKDVMAFVESLADVNKTLITIAEHREYLADFGALLERVEIAQDHYCNNGVL